MNFILFIIVIFSFLSFFDSFAIVSILIITEFSIGLLKMHEDKSVFNRIIQISLLISSFVGVLFLISKIENILYIYSVFSYIIAIVLLFDDLIKSLKKWKELNIKKKIISFIPISILLILVIISFFLLKIFLNRDEELVKYRMPMDGNIIDDVSGENITYKWEEKYIRIANETYDSLYSNNTFDVYYNDSTFKKNDNPVFIYLHGGGYYAGDKFAGDSNSSSNIGLINMFKDLIDNGFVVISINYALSPEYRYPTPVLQLSEFIEYLNINYQKYKVDMSKIFLGGGSAGGNIIGQFINIQTNEEYAKKLNIKQVIIPENIRGAYFGCALFDNSRFDDTNSPISNYAFRNMGLSYFDTTTLENNELVDESNVITYVNEKFPPSFVSDGNFGTFNDQAHDFVEKLNIFSVKYEEYILDDIDEIVPHSFDTFGGYYSNENNNRLIKFFKEVCL